MMELESLVSRDLVVPPVENTPTRLKRGDKVRWFWLAHECDDLAALYDSNRCPTDAQFLELRERHMAQRKLMMAIIDKAA